MNSSYSTMPYTLKDSKSLMTRLEDILHAADLTIDDLTYIHPYLIQRMHGWGRKCHALAEELLEEKGSTFGKWRDDTKGKCLEQLNYYVNHRDEIRRLVDNENEGTWTPHIPTIDEVEKHVAADKAFRREAVLRIFCTLITAGGITYDGKVVKDHNDLLGIAIVEAEALINALEKEYGDH